VGQHFQVNFHQLMLCCCCCC